WTTSSSPTPSAHCMSATRPRRPLPPRSPSPGMSPTRHSALSASASERSGPAAWQHAAICSNSNRRVSLRDSRVQRPLYEATMEGVLDAQDARGIAAVHAVHAYAARGRGTGAGLGSAGLGSDELGGRSAHWLVPERAIDHAGTRQRWHLRPAVVD